MSMTISGMGGAGSAQAWSGASMRTPPTQKMAQLFDKIDTSGSGTVTKDQFEQAFSSMNPPAGFKQQGADNVWAKLDPNGTGSVSKQDFIDGMKSMRAEMRAQHQHGGGAARGTTSAAASTAAAQTSNQSLNLLNALEEATGGSGSTIGSSISTTA